MTTDKEQFYEQENETLKELLAYKLKEKQQLQFHILTSMTNGDWQDLAKEKPDLFEHTYTAIMLADEKRSFKTTIQDVKDLRNKTGCGMIRVKKVLDAFEGDKEKALLYLRKNPM